MELATQAGNSYLQQMASCQMGYAYVYVGRHAEAIQLLEPFADDGAASSALGMLRWYMLSALAETHRREGELETARAIATRAVELGHANGALTAEYNAQLVLASTLAATHGEGAGPAIDAALARADSLWPNRAPRASGRAGISRALNAPARRARSRRRGGSSRLRRGV